MRKRDSTVLGVLIVALTIQTAAAARNSGKPARAPAPATQQLRDTRHGPSAPANNNNKSCDILWCYQD